MYKAIYISNSLDYGTIALGSFSWNIILDTGSILYIIMATEKSTFEDVLEEGGWTKSGLRNAVNLSSFYSTLHLHKNSDILSLDKAKNTTQMEGCHCWKCLK